MAIYRNKEELEKLIKLNINYPIASVDTNIFQIIDYSKRDV